MECLNVWSSFAATTVGRDKLYRTVQYFARFLAFYLSKIGSPDVSKKLALLSSTVGLSRKLFRIGKPLDHLRVVLRAIHDQKDDNIKWLTIGKATGFGCWLLLDSLQWLHATRLIEMPNPAGLGYQAARFWASGLACSALANACRLHRWYFEKEERSAAGSSLAMQIRMIATDEEGRAIGRDFIQDLLDLIIPLSLMGSINVSPGTVGLAGTITSLMGMYNLLSQKTK